MKGSAASRKTQRRLRAVTFLAAAAVAGAGLLTVPAAAPDPPAGTFQLAAPALGDAWTYEGQRHEWMRDTALRQPGGPKATVNALRIGEPALEPAVHGGDRMDWETLYLEAGTEGLVAREHGSDGTSPDGVVSHRQSRRSAAEGWAALPCGTRNALQGTAWDLASELPQPPGSCWPHGGTWRAVALTQQGPHRLLHAELSVADGRWQATFREDIPVPARLRPPWDDPLLLTAFARGTSPLASFPVPDGSAPPAFDWQPRTRFLFDTTAHPFPLEEAVAAARDDPLDRSVANFLQNHPASYVAQATFSERQRGPPWSPTYAWDLTVADGSRAINVSVVRSDALPLSTGPASGQVPDATASHSVAAGESYPRELPTPEVLPPRLPTVASLWAAWADEAAAPFDVQQPNAWWFEVACAATCAEAALTVSAGIEMWQHNYTTGATPFLRAGPFQETQTEWRSMASWRLQGDSLALAAYHETRQAFDHGEGVEALLQQPAPAASPEAMAGVQAWLHPVGAGAVAAAAILYAMWPWLKAGVAALFSRVHPAQAPQHPRRQRILEVISADPGIHVGELRRRTGFGHGALVQHLRRLQDAGWVTAVATGRYTCYFPGGQVPAQQARRAMALKAAGAMRVLEAIGRLPGASLSQVARDAGVAPATAHHHIERLVQAGLVARTSAGGRLVLHAVRAA